MINKPIIVNIMLSVNVRNIIEKDKYVRFKTASLTHLFPLHRKSIGNISSWNCKQYLDMEVN